MSPIGRSNRILKKIFKSAVRRRNGDSEISPAARGCGCLVLLGFLLGGGKATLPSLGDYQTPSAPEKPRSEVRAQIHPDDIRLIEIVNPTTIVVRIDRNTYRLHLGRGGIVPHAGMPYRITLKSMDQTRQEALISAGKNYLIVSLAGDPTRLATREETERHLAAKSVPPRGLEPDSSTPESP